MAFAVPIPQTGSDSFREHCGGGTQRADRRILVYGDSLTRGYPGNEPYARGLSAALAAADTPSDIVGCGLCGLTSTELVAGLDAKQLSDVFDQEGSGIRDMLTVKGPFDLVLIMAGTNDLADCDEVPDTPGMIVRNLAQMHSACHAAGIRTVALSIPESSVSTSGSFPELTAARIAANKELAAWVQKAGSGSMGPLASYIDTEQLIAYDGSSMAKGLWESDGLHFSPAGSKQFGENLAPLLCPLLTAAVAK